MKEYSLEITYKDRFGENITRRVSVLDRGSDVSTEKQFLHDVSYQFTNKFLRAKGKLIGKITNIIILDETDY